MVSPHLSRRLAETCRSPRQAGYLRGIVRAPWLAELQQRPPAASLISGSLFPLPPGHWAVVREGLTNPWIPDNWSWGGVASEHCPVLAEFYAEKDWNKKEGPRNSNGVTLERSEANIKHER